MMKGSYLILAASLLLLASCGKEQGQLEAGAGGPEDVTVSFESAFEVPATKASFDGDGAAASVNRCKLQVLWEGRIYTQKTVATEVVEGVVTAKFHNLVLLKDQTYDFLFWADSAKVDAGVFSDLYYQTDSLVSVCIDTLNSVAGNSDTRDAFSKCVTRKVTEGFTEKVTLTRPFAQLNVITTDTELFHEQVGDEIFAELFPKRFGISYTAPVKFNVRTQTAFQPRAFEISGEAAYKAFNVKAGKQCLTMDYILADVEKQLVTVKWSADSPISPVKLTFDNVPLQRNYRTNIIGALLTETGNFDVVVDPVWFDPEYWYNYPHTED